MATIAPITLGDVALWSHGLHASVLAVGSHVNGAARAALARLRVSNSHFNRDGDGRVVSLQEDSRDSKGC